MRVEQLKCLNPQVSWHRLERLELGFCGRGFGAEAVRALLAGAAAGGNAAALPGLRSLALKDAYRLEDADLHRLLAAAPNLEQLRLANCSRLQDAAQLARLAPHLRCAFLIGQLLPPAGRRCAGAPGAQPEARGGLCLLWAAAVHRAPVSLDGAGVDVLGESAHSIYVSLGTCNSVCIFTSEKMARVH